MQVYKQERVQNKLQFAYQKNPHLNLATAHLSLKKHIGWIMPFIQHVYVEMCFQAHICRNVLHDFNDTEKSYRSLAVSVKWNVLSYDLRFLDVHYHSGQEKMTEFQNTCCLRELL